MSGDKVYFESYIEIHEDVIMNLRGDSKEAKAQSEIDIRGNGDGKLKP